MHNDEKNETLGKRNKSSIFSAFLKNETVLKRFLSRFVSIGIDVEDITQETISLAIQAERNQEIRNPRAFLFGIAKNVVKSELTRKSKNIMEFIEEAHSLDHPSNEVSGEDYCDGKRKMEYFREAVATLPPQCQRVFVMARVYGMSHKEIERKLDISISTIEKHVAMGLQRCRAFMRQKLPGDVIGFDKSRGENN